MNAHIFERACPLYQEETLTPIFGGDMPPKKRPQKGVPLTGTNRSPVKSAVSGKLSRTILQHKYQENEHQN